MTIVKIFKQEDSSEKDAITILCDGEHIFGREKPLSCADRRISRKHAIITVKHDGVMLKSVHINPCFFRTQVGNVEKLDMYNSTPLNDGDQFSMLANSDWFKVKVTLGDSSGNKFNKKRSSDEGNSEEIHKKLKISKNYPLNTIVAGNVNDQVPQVSSFHDLDIIDPADVLINDLDIICEEESEDNLDADKASENVHLAGVTEEESILQSNENYSSENTNNKILRRNLIDGQEHENEMNDCSVDPVEDLQPRQSSHENDLTIRIGSTATGSIYPVGENCPPENSNNNASNEHAISYVNQEYFTEDQNIANQDIPTPTEIPIVPAEGIRDEPGLTFDENIVPGSSVKQEPLSADNIKQEPVSDENIVQESVSNEAIKQEPISDENIKKEPGETSNNDIPIPNNPSSSNDQNMGHNSMRRDRCWYGQNCYRKNSAHRSNISHPGDNDYDSDPNDVRAICPYGRACYRVNPQHRKEFKHYGKPAPKPSNVRFVVNVNNNCCSNCKHRKPGYESDCESDPENEQ